MTIDLDKLEALEKAATAGPWRHNRNAKGNESDPALITETGPSFSPGPSPIATGGAFWSHVDFDLVVALRNAAPELIAAARMLDELLGALPRCEHHALGPGPRCTRHATVGIVSHEPRWCDEHKGDSGYPNAVRDCDWADIVRRRNGS